MTSKVSELEKTLIKSTMLNLGIVPYTDQADSIVRMLKHSSPEEIRKMKRKFRKIWKKLEKLSSKKVVKDVGVDITKCKAKTIPTNQEKMRRKRIVLSYVQNTLVKPLLETISNLKSK